MFKFLDKIIITKGFYEGIEGTLIDDCENTNRYDVEIFVIANNICTQKTITISGDKLRKK